MTAKALYMIVVRIDKPIIPRNIHTYLLSIKVIKTFFNFAYSVYAVKQLFQEKLPRNYSPKIIVVATHLSNVKMSGIDVAQRIKEVGEEIRTIAKSVGFPAIGKIFTVGHRSHNQCCCGKTQ
jgi:hypothetical protein